MIIGLSGYAQAGKDSVGQVLVDEYGYKRYAFADALRGAIYALNPIYDASIAYDLETGEASGRLFGRVQELVDFVGWDDAKVNNQEIRRLLQAMGTEAGRKILGEDVWVNAVFNQVNEENVVITDARFPNEAQRVKAEGGFMVRVTRPGVQAVNNHPSEVSLDEWGFDLTIPNDGTLGDLRLLVKDGLQKLQLMHDRQNFPTDRLPGYGAPVAKLDYTITEEKVWP